MKFLIAASLSLLCSIAHAQGVRPDYCDHDPYGRSVSWNLWHCGMVDERRPKDRPYMETEAAHPADMIPKVDPEADFEFVFGAWQQVYHLSLFGVTSVGSGMIVDSTPRLSESYRRGGDAELAALGHEVWIGSMSIGHICIRGQKYISTMTLRENEYTMTFTCAKDELHLIGPTIKHKVLKVESVPYTGGSTWQNMKVGSK